jgi:hypothetical protein
MSPVPAAEPAREPLPAPAPKPAVTPRVPARPPSDTKLAGIVVGGAGVVGLAASIYFFAHVRSKLDERNAICPSGKDCEPGTNARLHSLTENASRDQAAGIAFAGLGAVATAVGLGLWLSTPHQSVSGHGALSVTPMVGPTSGGLVLQGAL